MYYLRSSSRDPYYNLALEEYLFENLPQKGQCLMLWQNENTIVVGRNQNTAEEINQQYVDAHHIRVARRLSGGGAVYHDGGNLNYTMIMEQDDFDGFHFRIFSQPVIRTLKKFGVEAEFGGRNDILIDGKKFSGGSQYARDQRLLHHGCIMLDMDAEVLQNALRVREAKICSKGIKSVRSRVTSINSHVSKPISMKEFETSLVKEICGGNKITEYCLDNKGLETVDKIRQEKYALWEWNYGCNADYELVKERRFPAGTVSVHMNVKKGMIAGIRLYGDFFGIGPADELERKMKGLNLDSSLIKEMEKLDVPYYINGITAKDMYELLMY